jgi:hypothetical protein
MKKLLVIGGVVAGLLVVAGFVLALFLGHIVAAGVNSFGPKITQTRVSLASASVSPLSGRTTLNQFVVGNPVGWSDANLCSFGRVHLEVSPLSILDDHIEIQTVDIDAPEFNYETKFVASNVGDLLKNLEAAVGGGKTGTPEAKAGGGKPLRISVKKIRIQNGKVRVGVGDKAVVVPMAAIEINDIGTKEGGVPPDQLVVAVMRSVTPGIISAATQAALELGKTGGAGAVEGMKKAGEAIKSLFGGEKK